MEETVLKDINEIIVLQPVDIVLPLFLVPISWAELEPVWALPIIPSWHLT